MSMRDSPLAMAEPFSEREITYAPERLAASSKETAVLVDASKKARQTVLLSSTPVTRPSANALARSRISLISSRPISSRLSKLLVSNDDHPVLPIGLLQVDKHSLAARGGHVLSDVVGAERQLAVTAVDEDRELHGARPTDVAERVQGRADRTTRVEDVVDEDDQRGTVTPANSLILSASRATRVTPLVGMPSRMTRGASGPSRAVFSMI